MISILTALRDEYRVKRPVTDGMIEKIAKGDTEELHELYEVISATVFGFALSITKNKQDAEDVLHETFIAVWQNAHCYKPNGKPMAWIFTIARNFSNMKHRSAARFSDEEPENQAQDIFSLAVCSENKIILQKVFSILTEEERQIVLLHAVGGIKHREISEVLGLATGTVLSKYNRAIKKLKTALEGEM